MAATAQNVSLQSPFIQKVVGGLSTLLRGEEPATVKEEAIVNHLKLIESSDSRYTLDIDFPSDLTWLNTDKTLSFSDQLSGKIVVLDFFTYCCINCIHILPDLHRLESRFTVEQDGVLIIGVHSAKFPNEKGSENILNAILRYDITHPVVNDANIELWERMGVSCWPTLVIIGPDHKLIYYIIGEGHYMELDLFVEAAVRYYKSRDLLRAGPVGVALEKDKFSKNVLSFPGKVIATTTGGDGRVFVSDSSNHRVLAIDASTGLVRQVYGSGLAGRKDGVGKEAEFNGPQGLAVSDKWLFVADTDNHLIRKVNLFDHSVVTVAGTGCQGDDKVGGKMGTEQEISSPWDLSLNEDSSILYIAMAGVHQLWALILKDTHLFKNNYSSGTVVRIVGSGEEANKNNSFPYKAALAQPSGIDLSADGSLLYVADSESSTVRIVSTIQGSVKGLVGGALDPMDLFAFGDKDGKGRDVRLQHPLGVAWDETRQVLYVADSYNHKIKCINPSTKACTTLAGTGSPGLTDGPFEIAQFSEPGGLCMGDREGRTLLIADTNNHCIRVMNLLDKTVNQFNLHFPSVPLSDDTPDSPDAYIPLTRPRLASLVTFDPVTVPQDGEVTISLAFELESGYKLNKGSLWQLVPVSPDCGVTFSCTSKGIIDLKSPLQLKLFKQVETGAASVDFKVEVVIMCCSLDEETCSMKQYVLCQPLYFSDDSHSRDHSLVHVIKVADEDSKTSK